MNDADFTKKLIVEMESRPGLYNMQLPEYSDRNLKHKLWEEVCEHLIPTWKDLNSKEKSEKGQEVQKRWKSLRDCFRREVALQKNTPSGTGCKKRRKYMYFEQLQFLITTLEQRTTTSSLAPSSDTNDSGDVIHTPEPDASEQHPVQSTPKMRNKAEKRHSTNAFEKDLIQLLEKKAIEDVDDDKQFLMSLLPAMKKIDENKKLLLRIEIMKTISKLQNDIATTHQPSTSWQSQSTSWYSYSRTPLSEPSPSVSEPSLHNSENSELYDLGETYESL